MASFWDQITGRAGSDAANAAASDQYNKQLGAASEARSAGSSYQQGLNGVSQNYAPYTSAGNSALERLLMGLGLGGDQGQFASYYQGLPGYQSGLDTGTKAVTSKLNAGSGIQSGAAMKALYKYGSDYENQRSGDYLNRLSSLAGSGLTATDAQSKMQQQGYTGQLQGNLLGAQYQYGAAPTIGQGQIAGANAEAAGSQNLLNTGIGLAGAAMGGMGGFGSSFGGAGGGGALGSLFGGGTGFMHTPGGFSGAFPRPYNG